MNPRSGFISPSLSTSIIHYVWKNLHFFGILTPVRALSIKQIAIFFAIIGAFSLLLVLGFNAFLKTMGGNGRNSGAKQQENQSAESNSYLPSVNEARTEIQAVSGDELVPSVAYRNGFQPIRVPIDGIGIGGCVVVLRNGSAVPLRIGISPHRSDKDPGPDYGVIPSGERLIFDPRFVGITELKMHNHDKPDEEFGVILGPKCQL